MKALIILGSNNPEGRTARGTKAICRGFEKAGGTTETVILSKLNIERCRQCELAGWGVCNTEVRCIIEDDFISIFEKIKKSDVVVFATPVYFADLSDSMRNFTDRLRRITFRKAEKAGTQGIPAVGMCIAGGSGFGAPSACYNLEKVLLTCGFDIVDMIPFRRQNFDTKLKIFEITGEWLATKPTSGNPPGMQIPIR